MIHKKVFTTDEKNKSIIENISRILDKFCIGEYKAEANYPVASSNITINIGDKMNKFSMQVFANKDENAVLKHVRINIS